MVTVTRDGSALIAAISSLSMETDEVDRSATILSIPEPASLRLASLTWTVNCVCIPKSAAEAVSSFSNAHSNMLFAFLKRYSDATSYSLSPSITSIRLRSFFVADATKQ